jgi:S1-C subfamily serine protease
MVSFVHIADKDDVLSIVKNGIVDGVHHSVKIHYNSGPIDVGGLIQLRAATGHKPTQAGDSGAPILTEGGRLIGIIIAGSAENALAIPIQPLFDALGVELY